MKRFVFSVFVLMVFVALVAAGPAWSKEPIKIGGIFSLTGYLSWLGEYKKKAAELKVEMINQAGGVNGQQLVLISYDDNSSPEQASKVAQRLISKDQVVAMAGTASVPLSGAVASMANRYKIPTIINSGYAVDTSKDPYLFNTSHKTDFAVITAYKVFQKKGIKKLALLMPIGPLGEIGGTAARKYAAEYGVTIVGEEKFDVKAADVTAQLAKIRNMNPQAIFAFVTGEPAALIGRNMDQLSFKVPLLVSHGNANPGFLKLVSNVRTQMLVPSGKVMKPEALPDSDPPKRSSLSSTRNISRSIRNRQTTSPPNWPTPSTSSPRGCAPPVLPIPSSFATPSKTSRALSGCRASTPLPPKTITAPGRTT